MVRAVHYLDYGQVSLPRTSFLTSGVALRSRFGPAAAAVGRTMDPGNRTGQREECLVAASIDPSR